MVVEGFSGKHSLIVTLITNARFQVVFAGLSLCIILLLIVTFYDLRPYDGMEMDFHSDNFLWVTVDAVYAEGPADEAGIVTGDRILAVNNRSFRQQGNVTVYPPGLGSGDRVSYELLHGQQTFTLSFAMGSYFENIPLLGKIVGLQFLALTFWGSGVILCLLAPHYDVRSRLIGLPWLMGGIVIAATEHSGWVCRSTHAIMYAMANMTACFFAIALFYFPEPSFVPQHKWRVNVLTGAALLLSTLVILESRSLNLHMLSLAQLADIDVYDVSRLFVALSVLIGVGTLLRNYFLKSPDVRRQIGIIFWSVMLGGGPITILTLLPPSPYRVPVVYTLPFTALIPLSYVYVIHQRKLLRVDFIINRIVVFFVLILLTLTGATVILGGIARAFDLPTELSYVGGFVVTLLSLLAASLHKAVQERVNQVLYGVHYDFSTVTSESSRRLVRTLDRNELIELLVEDLPQQMAIEQAALFLVEKNKLVLQDPDDKGCAIAPDDELYQVLLDGKVPVRVPRLQSLLSPAALARWGRFDWAQLFVPLIFESQLDGLLILGERAAGDVYSDQDVHIIATVAHQGALAYANVQLIETLRGLNRRLVRADEARRKHIARELHDTALQQLFFVKHNLLHDEHHTNLLPLLDEIIDTLRQTIKAERPPLLDQGLRLALQGLVEETQALAGASPTIHWRGDVAGRLVLSDEQATALYRIAQETLANALKHAGARNVYVTLDAGGDGTVRLCIEDDGVGMPTLASGWPGELHYGLTGIQERATLIGAQLRIASALGEGTSIVVEKSLP